MGNDKFEVQGNLQDHRFTICATRDGLSNPRVHTQRLADLSPEVAAQLQAIYAPEVPIDPATLTPRLRVMKGALNRCLALLAVGGVVMLPAFFVSHDERPWYIFAALGFAAVGLFVMGSAIKWCNDNKL
jgi:hypothetical protein